MIKMKNKLPIHPILFAICPVMSIYYHNIGEATLSIILAPTAITLIFTIFLLVLTTLIFRDLLKAAIIVSFFLLFFFSYRGFSNLVIHLMGDHADRYLLHSIFLILTCITYLTIKIRTSLINFTKTLNVVATLLFLFLFANIGVYKFKTLAFLGNKSIEKTQIITTCSETANKLPDIYYIILDRYANESILKDIYNFDNSEFVNYLYKIGFYVASQSNANYLKTAHSLSSSLNMEYINYLSKKVKGPTDNWLPIYEILEDYKIWRFLKSKGYKFIHFGSWWPPTNRNKFADKNINLCWLSNSVNVLYVNTMLYPIFEKLGFPNLQNFIQWKRVLYKFDKLAEIPSIKEPTFVFSHMLIPHPPFVFDRNGNFISGEMVKKRSNKENYIEQLIFTNKKVEELIDKLISNSEVSPIIILQADEGPFPRRYRIQGRDFNWKQASKTELRQKMGILNAYYLPDFDKNVLYPSITPVNSFRLILNHYFNTHYKLLPDKNYAFVDERHPYMFFDVTELANGYLHIHKS